MTPHGGVGRRAPRHRVRKALVFALCIGASSSGYAAVKLQAGGETSLGVTDNAQSAPDVPLPGGSSKSAGVFLVLRPGLSLGVLSARTVQRLAYTFDYNLFFTRNATSSSANRLEYRGFFDLSSRVNAIAGAAVTESDSYAAFTLAPPASGLLPLLPGGTSKLFTLSADELFNFDLGVGWRSWEGVGVSYGAPISGTDAPKTFAPNAKLGIEYSWTGDAVGAEARATYATVRDGIRIDGTRVAFDRELTAGGVGLFRHDLSRALTTSFEAGAVDVIRFETHQSHWYPVGGATLGYAEFFGDAQLSYTRLVTTNILLGQTILADEVRLRGGLPLDRRGQFLLGASAGYQIGRMLDENARTAANVSVLTVDATFGWQLNPWLLLGIRGQHIDQRSDVRVQGLPVSFVQNSVMLGAAAHFPPDLEMPGSYRAPRRVDRTDEQRGTLRPTVEEIPAPSGRAR